MTRAPDRQARASRRRARAATEFAVIAAVVYGVAALVLVVPAFFLATGVQAIGADVGWWSADPDAEGGEALVGTAVGLLSALVVLAVAALVVVQVGRRYLKPPGTPIAIGTAAIVVGLVAVCVGSVAA
jgi:hypothetical protein